MYLPLPIQFLAEQGLAAMRAHPQHHFSWRVRREIYHALQRIDRPIGSQTHGWLALFTAQHVLPIFTQAILDDPLPQKLVRYAELILLGKRRQKSARVNRLLEDGYHGSGIDNLAWRSIQAINAEYAGEAAYKALLEVSGRCDLLDGIETGLERGWVQARNTFNTKTRETPYDVTDAGIAHLAALSDTASSAAIAYACKAEARLLNRSRLQEFWEWWAITALPPAWERAKIDETTNSR